VVIRNTFSVNVFSSKGSKPRFVMRAGFVEKETPTFYSWQNHEWNNRFVGICTVYLHFLEKWRHFVSPKTLLWFRIRTRVSGKTFLVKRVFEQMQIPICLQKFSISSQYCLK